MSAHDFYLEMSLFKDNKIIQIEDSASKIKFLSNKIGVPLDEVIDVNNEKHIRYYSAYINEGYDNSLYNLGLNNYLSSNFINYKTSAFIISNLVLPFFFFSTLIIYKRGKELKKPILRNLAFLYLPTLPIFSMINQIKKINYNSYIGKELQTSNLNEIAEFIAFKNNLKRGVMI